MSQKKVRRTEQYETAVKTAIMDDMVLKQLEKGLEELRQTRFDLLIRQGIIYVDNSCEDASHIFDPTNGINWITT